MNKRYKRLLSVVLSIVLLVGVAVVVGVIDIFSLKNTEQAALADRTDTIVLRICNWEEYIDTGGWDEAIKLDSGEIKGDNSIIEDFEEWYYQTYNRKVVVEYSTVGTNEELYNMLTLGDEYDLVCPSEYMIMKLLAEDWLEPFSDGFFDKSTAENYYVRGVSPFIQETFDKNTINGEAWSRYAAGYMWGITGIVYNPEKVTKDEASTWKIISNEKFKRQITVKDNVRDSMFAAIGALKSEVLTSASFCNGDDYGTKLADEMNDTSEETLEQVQEYMQQVKDNVYSFETDSGKADMVTGKVVAGYQWSGDAVYTLDQAENDDLYLDFAVPKECTNLYFDGWCMLKNGIKDDENKKLAAEAFINFLSIPENAVRNMDYIGYTSVISGGDSQVVYDYIKWNYGTEEESENKVIYPLGYFFSGDSDDIRYMLETSKEQTHRQLAAQYPSEDMIQRSAVMSYFDTEQTSQVNQMWINVRCYNIENVPIWAWIVVILIVIGVITVFIQQRLKNKEYDN